ncbi:MAG: hypothetical protein J07AB43_01620 [Candidatus Nanosalina sp. J07AB43]|jgi:hypothetical protein|nr:MAG: hypothetical protein J07AB43_01620 [Candidatus Nanosalina sp. J07AB43]
MTESKSQVLECPDCDHRVLVHYKQTLTPTVMCGCGEAPIMEKVEKGEEE